MKKILLILAVALLLEIPSVYATDETENVEINTSNATDGYTWKYTFKDLPVLDKNGNEIIYTISENSKETFFNYFTHSLSSKNSNISESVNTYTQLDNLFDNSFFTQKLESFSCISFLSTGSQIMPPAKLKLIPYFIQDKYIY